MVLTGDYATWVGAWEPSAARRRVRRCREPKPLFRKLDPEAVVAEELGGWAGEDPEAA